ncbi:hypothetical protein M8J77_011532 [Diaphorina citri]|nr:hypothetical protein M8J77_011532 [Diaphorina citri]
MVLWLIVVWNLNERKKIEKISVLILFLTRKETFSSVKLLTKNNLLSQKRFHSSKVDPYQLETTFPKFP